jgi:hypothetical protein
MDGRPLTITEAAPGPDHPHVVTNRDDLGMARADLGDPHRARTPWGLGGP